MIKFYNLTSKNEASNGAPVGSEVRGVIESVTITFILNFCCCRIHQNYRVSLLFATRQVLVKDGGWPLF